MVSVCLPAVHVVFAHLPRLFIIHDMALVGPEAVSDPHSQLVMPCYLLKDQEKRGSCVRAHLDKDIMVKICTQDNKYRVDK